MPIIQLHKKKPEAGKNNSILDAAASENFFLPYSCRSGRCSVCRCRVISGTTSAQQPEIGLTKEEQSKGWILSCVRTAITDLALEVESVIDTPLPLPHTIPCRIDEIHKPTPSILRVTLRIPPQANFKFFPGQYIEVIGPHSVRRSYSIAGSERNTIELHIRFIKNGVMSKYWFQDARPNDLLRFYGPLGTFFLRDIKDKDIVFLATGTGISPVKCILEAMQDNDNSTIPRSITVLWGVRKKQDLYLDVNLLQSQFTYTPVLSQETKDNWNGELGHVQDVLLKKQMNLENTVIYACGSNEMIKSAHFALTTAGLPSNNFYSDAFVSTENL